MGTTDISDLLDSKRPGFLQWGVLLTPGQIQEASRRGLKSASGKSFQLIEPAVDPLSAKTLRLGAPPELRAAIETAQARFSEAVKIGNRTFEKLRAANRDRSEFSRSMIGVALTDAGRTERDRLDRAISDAEKDRRESESIEEAARVEVFHNERKLQAWIDDERLRLIELTKRAAEIAKKPAPVPLGERLAKLKNKITG